LRRLLMATVAQQHDGGGTLPPHSLDAEASVLGTILLTEQALDGMQIEVGLRPADFYRPRHALIFGAMAALKEKAEPEAIDALTVCEQLKQMGSLEAAGGHDYVHSLPSVVPSIGNVLHYARIVKGHSMRRRLLDVTREIQGRVLNNGSDPQELIDQAEHLLFQVGHEEGSGELKSIDEILSHELDKLERLSREGADVTGTRSGFTDIDEVTGGFQPGNLIVLAARPSMGKSALVTNMAENAAIDNGRPVAIFSLEMSETEIAQRFVASQAKISGDELRKGRVKEDRWPRVLNVAEKIAASPLYIDDSSDIGIAEIRAKARRLHAKQGGLGLLIVDYLQLMRPDASADSRVEQIGQMSRGLKILARELDIPVIAVSQLSRAVEQRPDKRPLLSDLRESGCLAGDSLVYLPDSGGYKPVSELVGRADFHVLAVNPATWKLEPRTATNVFETGRRPVFELATRLGRRIRATANHRFLTLDGWRRLDELGPGARIATPRGLPGPRPASIEQSEPALLGQRRGSSLHRSNLGRDRGARVAAVVESDERPRLAQSDVHWDLVSSVEPKGQSDVFDITVEGLHNFVADNVVVHNSIEQDADVVMFVFREEYYAKQGESERPGEADIIIAKHRNGPIGDVTLTFQSRYPKFNNFMRADGHGPDGRR